MKILAGREDSMYQGPVTENNESWSENPQSGWNIESGKIISDNLRGGP